MSEGDHFYCPDECDTVDKKTRKRSFLVYCPKHDMVHSEDESGGFGMSFTELKKFCAWSESTRNKHYTNDEVKK